MKYELETIPVWDGVRSNSECFICDLMQEAHRHAVAYYLGTSVMHPETRVEVNTRGFCPNHWEDLIAAGKPQSLALLSHTYLQTSLSMLSPEISRLEKGRAGRNLKSSVQQLLSVMHEREQGCLICTKMESRLLRYTYTVIYLWQKDLEFRDELSQSKGFCLHHMESLLRMAPSILDAKEHQVFSAALTTLVHQNLQRLEEEVLWTTQKYKAEHTHSPWNGCEDAQKRLVNKLIGVGRIFVASS